MTRVAPARDPAVRRVIDHFYAAFIRTFNPPGFAETWLATPQRERKSIPKKHMVLPRILGAKDGSLVKKMLDTWGEETTLRLVDDYFARWQSGDPRIMRTNADIGGLWMVAQYLLISQHNGRVSPNLVAAARASSPRE